MVNVPPIPPLLCSTPPPIDFGEDDDDVDVLPPTLDGVDDDDFGNFLAVDDEKTNEPLPSPRPPSSECDLPPVSIYDGFSTPDEDLTNHNTTTPPPPPVEVKLSENTKKSIPLTQAFNFDVKNTHEETKIQEENKSHSLESKPTEESPQNNFETESSNLKLSSSQPEYHEITNLSGTLTSSNKNIKDLTIETINNETKCNNSKAPISCMQNIVSIEDLEDDMSDDELYSPKTPKNFVETDNLTDYFKIEEVTKLNSQGLVTKSDSKDADIKSLDSLDNNESASFGNDNDNEFKSFSSNSFVQNNFDLPPPLQDDSNSIDDDDFGDFADFQDFNSAIPAETQNSVNKETVPVNDINGEQQDRNDLELNGFKDFTDYNKTKELKDKHTAETVIKDEDQHDCNRNKAMEFNGFKVTQEEEKSSEEYNLETAVSNVLEIKTQDIPGEEDLNNEEEYSMVRETLQSTKKICNADDSFGDFNAASEINDNDDDFGNFAEFSNAPENYTFEKTSTFSENTKTLNDNPNDDDEFDDFANFESHQQPSTTDEAKDAPTFTSSEVENEEDDDDDFGDFNTAEPITTTASSVNLNKTSHDTITASISLPSSQNLNERISKILQLMFTPELNNSDECRDELKSDKIQDIPFTSIDAAKALEYQWLNSDTRHSFIRSLGIDSRNILYGENWNPSLPRFAANLSFNPLKPMKPIQSSTITADSFSTLEPIPINNLESNKTLDVSGTNKKETTLDLNWKSSSIIEQSNKASKDSPLAPTTTPMPYVSNEPPPQIEPVSLAIFENPLENEEKLSKTPPISEMESVTTFSSPIPAATLDMELPITQMANNLDDFDLKEVEENLKNTLNINEVVVTSTFTGSFKESHIYTPPKTNDFESKPSTGTSPTKASPIDFDYEKAAMGVIIDETVVKKEYRDIEYNPPFTMESLSKTVTTKMEMFDSNSYSNSNVNANILTAAAVEEQDESNDDFSEFQSVPSDVTPASAAYTPYTATVNTTKPLEVPKNTTVSHGGMILSPAILIPQAISMENQKPKIEWGDSTATINAEEMARIEELFPEPKPLKSSNGSNSSQKSTPTHQVASTPSISATVASKEMEGNINHVNDDDDDWSDFVSVTVSNNGAINKSGNCNNNILSKSPAGSPFKQRSPVTSHRMSSTIHSNSNNDDEWSDFVSSAPPSQHPPSYRVPQFNSGAWQNANFYNNPLSMYHKGPLNLPTAAANQSAQKSFYNNNNNYNISQQQPYQIANNIPPAMLGNHQQQPNNGYQQQIHVMQNFSTAPVPTPERISAAMSAAKNNQFQSIGSAKVAPSIALIPDLGFVAPAIPTHTSFINSLPKPSINTKK